MPAGWADEQALGLVVTWPTALAVLKPLGGVTAGQTVLIHAAAGGTGQAAVRMATLDASMVATKRVTGPVVVYGVGGGEAPITNWELVDKHQIHVIGISIGTLIKAAPQIFGAGHGRVVPASRGRGARPRPTHRV